MRTILFLCLSILFLPLTLMAEDNQLDLSQGNVTITENGTYTITSNGNETSNHIIVNENLDNVSITLDNVKVVIPGGKSLNRPVTSAAPMIIKERSKVTLTLKNQNSLICNSNSYNKNSSPGLDILSNAEVTIQGDGNLTVQGGDGANYYGAPGIRCTEATLIIDGGTIVATGNNTSAGIKIVPPPIPIPPIIPAKNPIII